MMPDNADVLYVITDAKRRSTLVPYRSSEYQCEPVEARLSFSLLVSLRSNRAPRLRFVCSDARLAAVSLMMLVLLISGDSASSCRTLLFVTSAAPFNRALNGKNTDTRKDTSVVERITTPKVSNLPCGTLCLPRKINSQGARQCFRSKALGAKTCR